MGTQQPTNGRLDGWKAIADYLGWHERTVIRWEKQKGLPIHRVEGGKRAPVYAYQQEIDLWFQKNWDSRLASEHEVPDLSEPLASATEAPVAEQSRNIPWMLYASAATLAGVLGVLGFAWRVPGPLRVVSVKQLTSDGNFKDSLATDGRFLYFSERTGDDTYLYSMSVGGGPVKRIPVPIVRPYPQDISSDGRFLLVLSNNSPAEEHPLWIVPVDGTSPQLINGIETRTASWTPDQQILYGHQNALMLTDSSGKHSRLLAQLAGGIIRIQWSDDRKHLFISGESPPDAKPALWRVDVGSETEVTHVSVVNSPEGSSWEGVIAAGNGLIFSGAHSVEGDRIWALNQTSHFSATTDRFRSIPTQFHTIELMAAPPGDSHLFVMSGTNGTGELAVFNPKTQGFTNLLPRTYATYVVFSPDRDRVAFVREDDQSLYIGNPDGSAMRRLSPLGMAVQLPRWSPDGKSLAFMGLAPGRPYRDYVLALDREDALPEEASAGEDNQGAPTWSPDGRFLVYGNVRCHEDNSCAIHRIDLSTHESTKIAGSDGLTTARLSPDGRHIAALKVSEHAIYMLDTGKSRWRKLSDQIDGNDLGWSSDSSFVYAKSYMRGTVEIVRVPVSGGAMQTVVDLNVFSKAAGQLDNWFGLTPDNSIMLNHVLMTNEIYDISYSD